MSTIIFGSINKTTLYEQNTIIAFYFVVVFFFIILILNLLHWLNSILKHVIKNETQIETLMLKFVSSYKDDIKERKLICSWTIHFEKLIYKTISRPINYRNESFEIRHIMSIQYYWINERYNFKLLDLTIIIV